MVKQARCLSEKFDALKLVVELYYDLCIKCGHAPEHRDVQTLSRRYRHEGISYFTETLPTIGRDLERAVERGYVCTTDFAYLRKFKSAKYPCFCKVFFCNIFDGTGQLLPNPDPVSIGSVRQLSYFYKKIKEVCSESRVKKALEDYKAIEQELSTHTFPEDWRELFHRVSDYLWNSLDSFNAFEAVPKHGPGGVLERAKGINKIALVRENWPERLNSVFPYDSYCVPNSNYCVERKLGRGVCHYDKFENSHGSDQIDHNAVFVLAVPKTALKPRLIGEETTANMYAQQAIKIWLYETLENRNSPYKGHINFTDQNINRLLALSNSASKKRATLDMSSASERVPLDHIEMMLRTAPNLLLALKACRAEHAFVPTDVSMISKGVIECPSEIITLRKFASMGSACCFPIESIYFYTLCVMGILGVDSTPTYADINSACRKIWVYGDDIIVDTSHVESVMSALVAFGNKVNYDKSFWKGYFRESCGMDAYAGVEITPVYMRKHPPRLQTDPDWLSIVETANQLYENGLWRSSNLLVQYAESVLGTLPITEQESAGLHLWSYQGVPTNFGLPKHRVRINRDIQSQQIKLWSWSKRKKTVHSKGEDLLMSYFLDKAHTWNYRGLLDIQEGRHRDEIDRPESGTLKLRWFPSVPKTEKLT